MSRLATVFCLLVGLSGCKEDDNSFDISKITSSESVQSEDIGERWLAEILISMQGETGTYLKNAASNHNITVAYSDNLEHHIGEFSPQANTIILELPLGIETATEEQFQQMVLTGRRVMYEELDHGVRHHERDPINGLSAQEEIDGFKTSNEAIARITAYLGMSEDAQIGSVPPLAVQFGIPDNGYAIYYSVIDAEMADVIMGGLEEGKYFHETPDLIDDVFSAFYGTSTSEWYTLNYSSFIPNNFIKQYQNNVSLAQMLDDYKSGNNLEFPDFEEFTSHITAINQTLLSDTRQNFEDNDFTSEAENLTLNDLIRFKRRISQPDGGRANHLAKTQSGGDFFRDAPISEIDREFGTLINSANVIERFFNSCVGSSVIPTNLQDTIEQRAEIASQINTMVTETATDIRGIIGQADSLSIQDRLSLKQAYKAIEEPLVPLSSDRVTVYNNYIRGTRNDGVRLCP